jgi:hypothetical protein
MSVLRDVQALADPALAALAVADPPPPRFADVVADPDRLFVLEAVYEGHLMHWGEPRAFAGMDADMRLLAGDALYALGLERLAAVGDLDAITILSDLISATARAHADGRAGEVDALWEAGARTLAQSR